MIGGSFSLLAVAGATLNNATKRIANELIDL
jgi:hypothetical protein